jgi:glycosyltransferase involved in cell wall biosynthesis
VERNVSAPTVSVIMPSFNRLAYLRQAAASVFAQSFTDWELIVADDGSDPETRRYLQTLQDLPRVVLLLLPHSGIPGAVRNAAARVARGEWLAFLDSDDLWHPSKLATQLAVMRANPQRLWSFGAIERIDAAGSVIARSRRRPQPRPQGDILEHVIRWRAGIAMPTVMVKRELFLQTGGFDQSQPMFEDFDLWLRLAAASPASAVDTPLVSVRFHGDHFSSHGERALQDWIELFERWKPRLAAPRLQRALEAQCVNCTIGIARLQAMGGRRLDAFRTLFGARPGAWRLAAWWSGALRVALRCTPLLRQR